MSDEERAVIEAAQAVCRDWRNVRAATDEHLADLYRAVNALPADQYKAAP